VTLGYRRDRLHAAERSRCAEGPLRGLYLTTLRRGRHGDQGVQLPDPCDLQRPVLMIESWSDLRPSSAFRRLPPSQVVGDSDSSMRCLLVRCELSASSLRCRVWRVGVQAYVSLPAATALEPEFWVWRWRSSGRPSKRDDPVGEWISEGGDVRPAHSGKKRPQPLPTTGVQILPARRRAWEAWFPGSTTGFYAPFIGPASAVRQLAGPRALSCQPLSYRSHTTRGQVLTMNRRGSVDKKHSDERGQWVRMGILILFRLACTIWEMLG